MTDFRLSFAASSLAALALCTVGPVLHAQTAAKPNSIARATVTADTIVAVVNSEPVTARELSSRRQRLAQQAAKSGLRLSDKELDEQTLEQLIIEKAAAQAAREAGVRVEDEAVDQAVLGVANQNRLTREQLRERMEQEGLSWKDWREDLRRQIMVTRFRDREVEGKVRLSDAEVNQFLQEQDALPPSTDAPLINIGMILIAVPENASAKDVASREQWAVELVQRIRAGESFATIARNHSQAVDRGANGGAMGLRPYDRYPELFITNAEKLKPGEVSNPVRSGAGFHILTVLDKQQPEARGIPTQMPQTRARHILLRTTSAATETSAKTQLTALAKRIASGQIDFAAAARETSQDGSAAQGGDLGWAAPGQFVPEFETVMNTLAPGQTSEPFSSRYGVHLMQVVERRQVPLSARERRQVAQNILREQKLEDAYADWAQEMRARAYVEIRDENLRSSTRP